MVYTLGESLLDIIITSPNNVVVRPGGAMLNASISLGRSNIEVSLISELGDDDSSNLIINFLKENNVLTKAITNYPNNNSCVAIAFLDKDKKPSYTFYKKYPSRRKLNHENKFKPDDILLFGSLYSVDKNIRSEIKIITEDAQRNNATVIYDPNIRNAYHLNDKELMNSIIENMTYSNIIKGSDEDFSNIFGVVDTQLQFEKIREINNSALIIITLGSKGVIADFQGRQVSLPAIKTEVLSTIGAGDSFNAGIINALVSCNSGHLKTLNSNLEVILIQGLSFSSQVCASMDNYIS